MKQLTKIKKAIHAGTPLYWHTRQIMNINPETMNLGGKLKVRLSGSRYKTEIDISEITIVTSKKLINKLEYLEKRRKQCLQNMQRQKRQVNPRVRYQLWEQAFSDYTRDIKNYLKK